MTARIPATVLVPSVSPLLTSRVAAQQPNPHQQPGATVTLCSPEQHDLYDGHYILSANRIHMVGGLNDPAGWDHMDNEAKTVKPVAGTAEIDVNDLTNTGKFDARLKIPEGDLVLAIDKFNEFNPARTAGSSASCMNTVATQAAATTTGRRRSYTSRVRASAMPHSTASRSTRTTKCTSWSPRASATGRLCA
jgi:hypothetical protein